MFIIKHVHSYLLLKNRKDLQSEDQFENLAIVK